jgi:drug/metabolite transporter (DMT)-like permease
LPQAATSLTYFKLIAAMFMWGGTWIAGRIIAQEVAAPLAVASLRFVLAGLVVAAFAVSSGRRLPLPAGRQEWGVMAALAFTGVFLYGLCFFYGLQHLAAGRGALVVALNPVMVALLAWLFGQEKMSVAKGLGIAIAMAGCLTVIGNGDPFALLQGSVGLGEWLILGCALSWASYTFIGRRVSQTLPALAVTLYASLLGALFLGIAAVFQGDIAPAEWSLRVWASMGFLAIFGTAMAYTWFTSAVHQIGVARASVFINLVPVFAVLQAAVLLDERLGLSVLAGGLLVIAGVWLTSYRKETT